MAAQRAPSAATFVSLLVERSPRSTRGAANPRHQLLPRERARRQTQHDALRLVNVAHQLAPIQRKEDRHGGMADTLVPVDERVIPHDRVPECRCLLLHRWIQRVPTVRRPWLRECRLERAEIAEPCSSTCLLHDAAMKLQDFNERKIADGLRHLG